MTVETPASDAKVAIANQGRGLKPLEQSFVLIVGIARNCERTLERDLERLAAAFAAARQLAFLVVESDSSDGTVRLLQRLALQQSRFAYQALGVLADHLPQRTARIAYCRNRYLQALSHEPGYRDVDLVVVADLDGVNTLISPSAVQSCWCHADWDVCTANQKGPYYDIWALRHPLWSPNDCWKQVSFLSAQGLGQFRTLVTAVYGRMIRVSPSASWIEVDSAFGGLALYRRACLDRVSYEGIDATGSEVCEHVALHQQIRAAGGRILINPALINAELVEHAAPATRRGLVRLFLSSWLKRWLQRTRRVL